MTDTQTERLAGQLARLKIEHELILGAAGEGIYGLDCEGRTTFVNAAAKDILGWDEPDLLGKPLHDIHHHSHPDGTPYLRETCPIYAALKDGVVHRVDSEVFWASDGSPIPVEYTSTPIWQNGQLSGAVVVFRDISERKAIEQQRTAALTEVEELNRQLALERDYLRDEINITGSFGEIIGSSIALKRTFIQIEAVAKTNASVLIEGESGVGKEMVAQAIHSHSDRADKPMVKVNCASIPRDLFESEFFGHIKGSFTGAHRDRIGRLQMADKGTLFLDEVGEIPMELQSKLLRALQEQEFEKVGDEKTTRVQVRVVAATNKNLMEEVKKGNFREDLYYRLSVFPLAVPPLRERVGDIVPLTQHFINSICQQHGRAVLTLSRSQANVLIGHSWPGNIRELKNVVERAIILSSGSRLRLDLALGQTPNQINQASDFAAFNLDTDGEFTAINQKFSNDQLMTDYQFRELERENILKALSISQWRISGKGGAAELLDLKPSTLAYRMKNLKIDKPTTNT